MRKSFTIGGKPIPPNIFADFGDAWMLDRLLIVLTIGAERSRIDSNRYADPNGMNGRSVEQMKPVSACPFNGPETMANQYRGATA